jgi:probable HAF family extracellular repeat protein
VVGACALVLGSAALAQGQGPDFNGATADGLSPLPPAIATQPQSQAVIAGGTARFTVSATGATPLSYRWRFNGTNLPWVLAPTLRIDNAQLPNAGGYRVVVTNPSGSVTSEVAFLTVNFSLSVIANGEGSVIPDPAASIYSPGTVVNLEATPARGASFVNWSGDAAGTNNPLAVTMSSNRVITAIFAGPRITPLGDLSGGQFQSEANAISADGRTVVGFSSVATDYHAFRWTTAGGMVDLGNLPGGEIRSSFATSVSADGSIIAGIGDYGNNQTIQAFRWSSTGGMAGLGFFPGTDRISKALGMSADGSVIVGLGESTRGDEAFRWTAAGGIQGLGDLSGGDFSSGAYAVSGDGRIAVGRGESATDYPAVLWTTPTEMEALGHVLGAISAIALDISTDGQFVVGSDAFGGTGIRAEAFRWSRTTGFKRLGHIAGQLETFAGLSVSADGEVIVGGQGDVAFVWTPGFGMRRLWDVLLDSGTSPSSDGWSELLRSTGVSDDGRFVAGFGQRHGNREAFRADLLPAAARLTVVTSGNGSVLRLPDQASYPPLSVVSLTPVPNPGSLFVNWSGDAQGTNLPLTVTMTRQKRIIANFTNTILNLSTQGSGTISRSPERGYYDLGEEVTLTAVPGRWHVFARWTDGVTGNPRPIVINAINSYKAFFTATQELETVTFGGVARTAPVGMPAILMDGTLVTAEAVTNFDRARVEIVSSFNGGTILFTLDGSTPNLSSTYYAGPFTLRRHATVRAVAFDASFTKSVQSDPVEVHILPSYALTVSTAGGGAVSRSPDAPRYVPQSTVTLMATPAGGWSFLQWLGDTSGTSRTTDVTLRRDTYVEAIFGTLLGTATVGSGTVLVDPTTSVYPYGTRARLTAVPQPGNYFALWGGAGTGTNNPLPFVVTNGLATVTAVFQPLPAGRYALTVLANGFGVVSNSPRGNSFGSGTGVTLRALPDTGQSFLGWSGDASGTLNPLTVTVTQSLVISANFTRRPRLTLASPFAAADRETFSLLLKGEFDKRYEIESVTHLAPGVVWTPLGLVTNVHGTSQFDDRSVSNRPQRFYRAVLIESPR